MSELNKTQRLIKEIRDKISWGIYQPGVRIDSVREMAKLANVSTYTVAQAYDQLVASGELRSEKGIGYFVNTGKLHKTISQIEILNSVSSKVNQHVLDPSWIMEHLFHDQPSHRSPGSGLFTDDWMMDANAIGRCSRQVIRQIDQFIYGYGHLQGHIGLRQQFARQLAADHIQAHPDQMVTTGGVSHSMELLLRSLCQAGDSILVDDPCWYWIINCAQQMGLSVVGVPRNNAGIDLERFEQCLVQYQPKLYITNSRLHNPTGFSYSAQHLYKVLALLQQHNMRFEKSLENDLSLKDNSVDRSKCYLVEDDVFSHLCEEDNSLRFASLDGFDQVIYVNGVAKSLGGNWRVGVIVCPEEVLNPVLQQKMLSNTTCSELNERIIEDIWRSSNYSKHLYNMQTKLRQAHNQLLSWLIALGFITETTGDYPVSLFVWLDTEVDSAELAMQAHKDGWHVAPGHLFSANGNCKTHLRLNVTTTSKAFLLWLRSYIDNHAKQ